MKLTLAEIQEAVSTKYSAMLLTPEPGSQRIGDNVTLRSVVYNGDVGVVATVNLGWRVLTVAKYSGASQINDKPAPSLASLTAECHELRAAEYLPISELADAMTKIGSPDAAVRAAGKAQLDAYCAHNLAVKAKYPKPE